MAQKVRVRQGRSQSLCQEGRQTNIEKIKAELLKPARYNPRKDLKPGDKEYQKLRRSIEEFPAYLSTITLINFAEKLGLSAIITEKDSLLTQKPPRKTARTALLLHFQGKTKPPADKILFINRPPCRLRHHRKDVNAPHPSPLPEGEEIYRVDGRLFGKVTNY